ncbi:class I SAM-dependent methyltransferase [uncultured Helicobacter sp.]|uniref:class I SAM-dependent methyltransferase n=1 Tax=uncultured Helicobacter sp. TaxID=175537 RepID=UPI00262C2BBD|nr:class I SAM-dependent methyltransferase [uncultured Helicobacter sp.]
MIQNPTIAKYSEMIEHERAFVLEMLQKHKPKKICEIGIAAGANSVLILDYLNRNNLLDSTSLHAIDYNTTYYRDNVKQTGGGKPTPRKSGFLVQELVPELASYYHLHTGGLSANHLDRVGDKIDLCIIDTVHAAPGEALDFLMVLPYLAPNAAIIIHDLAYHCLADKHHSICALLFHTLVGDKTIPPQYAPYENLFQNIGSCILSPNQSTHVDLYFRLLHLPWVYMPNAEDLAVFKGHITKHYSREYLLAFEHILALQKTWQLSTPRRAARKVKRICKKMLDKITAH